MKMIPRKLPGLMDVHYQPFTDHRGYLAKPFDDRPFHDAGIDAHWRQIVLQKTDHKNTIKGLHIQREPFDEAKLIVPLTGKVLWVNVDLRRNSPTFLKWESTLLEPGHDRALFIERGFCHGSLSLTDDALLLIMADNHYSPEHCVGFAWDDPEIGIEWPLIPGAPLVMSDDHRTNPLFAAVRGTLGL